MRVIQRVGDVADDRPHMVARHRAFAREARRKAFSVDERHHEVHQSLTLVDRENRDDVGM